MDEAAAGSHLGDEPEGVVGDPPPRRRLPRAQPYTADTDGKGRHDKDRISEENCYSGMDHEVPQEQVGRTYEKLVGPVLPLDAGDASVGEEEVVVRIQLSSKAYSLDSTDRAPRSEAAPWAGTRSGHL